MPAKNKAREDSPAPSHPALELDSSPGGIPGVNLPPERRACETGCAEVVGEVGDGCKTRIGKLGAELSCGSDMRHHIDLHPLLRLVLCPHKSWPISRPVDP